MRRIEFVSELPNKIDSVVLSRTVLAMAKALARSAILDWEGIGDAEGEPLPVSPDAVDALLDIWPIFEAFNLLYVSRGMLLDAEKNGSAPLPTGTSVGAKATARPAEVSVPTAPRD